MPTIKEELTHYKNEAVKAHMLLDAIQKALDGEEPSDFELSFGIVREVYDLKQLLNIGTHYTE